MIFHLLINLKYIYILLWLIFFSTTKFISIMNNCLLRSIFTSVCKKNVTKLGMQKLEIISIRICSLSRIYLVEFLNKHAIRLKKTVEGQKYIPWNKFHPDARETRNINYYLNYLFTERSVNSVVIRTVFGQHSTRLSSTE